MFAGELLRHWSVVVLSTSSLSVRRGYLPCRGFFLHVFFMSSRSPCRNFFLISFTALVASAVCSFSSSTIFNRNFNFWIFFITEWSFFFFSGAFASLFFFFLDLSYLFLLLFSIHIFYQHLILVWCILFKVSSFRISLSICLISSKFQLITLKLQVITGIASVLIAPSFFCIQFSVENSS